MKRTPFLVVVPVMIGGAFLLLLLALMSRMVLRPSAWREQVDYYIRYRSGLSFVEAKAAAQPGEFRREMSGLTFSRYGGHTDFKYEESVGTSQRRPGLLQEAGGPTPPSPIQENLGDGGPMPYPPKEAWCVTLAQEGAGQVMIFVALHEYDMYSSEWITHEAAGDANTSAVTIGCK